MDMDLIETETVEIINGRKIIKKHVAAVHSSNNLSLLERKISNVLLYVAFPNLKTEKYHYITISRLKELLNFNSKNTRALKEAIQKLQRTVIELNLLNDKLVGDGLEEGLFSIQILGLFQVVEKGTIKYSYPPELIDLLANPSIYAKINLPVQAKFKSSYSLALYENCVRFRGLPYTKNFEYKIFRKLMGVEDGKYEIFRDFNRRVLTPAITEINTCSDIRITPDITRRGKRVQAIKFLLGERPIKKRIGRLELPKDRKRKVTTSRIAPEFGLTEQNMNKLIREYGEDRVALASKYIKSTSSYKNGAIPNISGYFVSAVKENYAEKAASAKSDQLDNKSKVFSPNNEVNCDYNYKQYVARECLNTFKELDITIQKNIEDEYFNSDKLKCDPQAEMLYKMNGVRDILIFEVNGFEFTRFLMKQYSQYFTGFKTFEEYCEQLEEVL